MFFNTLYKYKYHSWRAKTHKHNHHALYMHTIALDNWYSWDSSKVSPRYTYRPINKDLMAYFSMLWSAFTVRGGWWPQPPAAEDATPTTSRQRTITLNANMLVQSMMNGPAHVKELELFADISADISTQSTELANHVRPKITVNIMLCPNYTSCLKLCLPYPPCAQRGCIIRRITSLEGLYTLVTISKNHKNI